MNGTPSILLGTRMPCQWMVVGSSMPLTSRAANGLPFFILMTGGGPASP